MIIQASYNNQYGWSSAANFSFAMIIFLFIKDVTILTLFTVRKFIDGTSDPKLRPVSKG
jgi:hypothetical protein